MESTVRKLFSFVHPTKAYLRSLSITPTILYPRSVDDLENAKTKVATLSKDPGNDAKLKLYGLFKQATVGPCNTPKPGMMDFVGKAKWDAWNNLKDIDKATAIDQYCLFVDKLLSQDPANQPSSSSTSYKEIVITDEGGVRTITFNRPAKYNAITFQMYTEIQSALKEAGEDDNVIVTVLTGAGDYYCSGNDLSNFATIPPEGPKKLAADGKEILREFVSSFIQFPKVLVAAVNGPAVGISVTMLGLCDLVYASENATFHTPFMSLGQSPEGCSSVLFPRIMGPAKANEVLLQGKKLSSDEAFERGLVTRVFPSGSFHENIQEIVSNMATLPPKSLMKSKQLLRDLDRDMLEKANQAECDLLEDRWVSDECIQAIMSFMQRRRK